MQGLLRPLGDERSHRCLSRSYLCGLCHTLGRDYGPIYRLFARPDLVFFNVFMDAIDLTPAPIENRSCPLLPVLSRHPTRSTTSNSEFTAAFGLFMAVEKLRDDYQDEGGLHRWLLWQLFRPGWRRAQAKLESVGFPVATADRWLAIQSRLEQRRTATLARAMLPSAVIAGLLFGYAARNSDPLRRRLVQRLGRHVGRFLFAIDSLLDFFRDERKGQYNALARLPAEPASATDRDRCRLDVGIRAAQTEATAVAQLMPTIELDDPAGFVRSALVDGLADKVRRYQGLSDRQRMFATSHSIAPLPKLPWRRALRVVWDGALLRVRLALALAATWLAPRSQRMAGVAAALLLAAATLLPDLANAADGGSGDGGSGDGGTGSCSSSPCMKPCADCLCMPVSCCASIVCSEEGRQCLQMCPCAWCLYACK